jgi:predicted O-methyltransferase YrrM
MGAATAFKISSGHAALDVFLTDHYHRIPGMSSRFAAAICGHAIQRQSELGVTGDLMEIGTFEGRFFAAMALLLASGEHALGIDVFTWPDEGVYDRFLKNCANAGLPSNRYIAWKVDTLTITATELRSRLPSGVARFVHIDGEHKCLRNDLELAHAVLHPDGIIALDDMLHPGYPTLLTTVLDYLKAHPEMRVFCIIDRESITAAAKFLICRMMQTYARFHYVLGADFMGHFTLVLTPDPTLPKVD